VLESELLVNEKKGRGKLRGGREGGGGGRQSVLGERVVRFQRGYTRKNGRIKRKEEQEKQRGTLL